MYISRPAYIYNINLIDLRKKVSLKMLSFSKVLTTIFIMSECALSNSEQATTDNYLKTVQYFVNIMTGIKLN